MKATIIVSIVLCLVIGGIAGWALRGVSGHSDKPAITMMNVTPSGWETANRIAVLDGKTLTIVEYKADGPRFEANSSIKIK